MFLEFGGFSKTLLGPNSGKFGELVESKFLENFVPGVSVSLPLFVSPNLFSYVYIYLFRNLCLSLSIFMHLCVSQSVSFRCFALYLYLSVCVSLSLGLARVVSVYLCLFLCARVCRSALLLCGFLCLSIYFRVSAFVYLVMFIYICVCFYLSVCLRLLLRVGPQS